MTLPNYFTVATVIADKMPELLPATGGGANAADVTTVTHICEAVTAFIDSYTKRRSGYFSAPIYSGGPPVIEAGTERIYRGEGQKYLRIGVHVPGTVLITKPVMSAGATYERPDDPHSFLYAKDLFGGTLEDGYFDEIDEEQIKNFFRSGWSYTVKAVWKFPATPPDILEAGGEIIKTIWDKGKGVVGEVSPSGFVVERAIPLTAAAMLKPYIRRPFEIE